MDNGTEVVDALEYRNMVGGLLYLSHTHPDIAFIIRVASRFMSKPSRRHMGAVKRIMHYVASTINFGILYEHYLEFRLICYINSD